MANRPSTVGNRERFESKIGDRDGCWTWVGTIHRNGYGLFDVRVSTNNWQKRWAHRVAFELYRRPLQPGETIDHLCRNTLCVNPKHLDPCSTQENSRRAPLTLVGTNVRKTHCPHGHPYSGENLFYDQGKRKCRECVRARNRRADHARRAANDP